MISALRSVNSGNRISASAGETRGTYRPVAMSIWFGEFLPFQMKGTVNFAPYEKYHRACELKLVAELYSFCQYVFVFS